MFVITVVSLPLFSSCMLTTLTECNFLHLVLVDGACCTFIHSIDINNLCIVCV